MPTLRGRLNKRKARKEVKDGKSKRERTRKRREEIRWKKKESRKVGQGISGKEI